MATHSSVLAWRIPGTGKPGELPSLGSHRVGHDWSDLAAVAAAAVLSKFRILAIITTIQCWKVFIIQDGKCWVMVNSHLPISSRSPFLSINSHSPFLSPSRSWVTQMCFLIFGFVHYAYKWNQFPLHSMFSRFIHDLLIACISTSLFSMANNILLFG